MLRNERRGPSGTEGKRRQVNQRNGDLRLVDATRMCREALLVLDRGSTIDSPIQSKTSPELERKGST